MNTSFNRFAFSKVICACLTFAGIVGVMIPSRGWDSAAWNPTHPTHSYLTEWAIDKLKTDTPEANAYRKQIVQGANAEPHELSLKEKPVKYNIDLEAKRKEHKGTNEGCDDIEGWWRDSLAAYRHGNKEQAYFLLGIMLHMVEDMGVPAHANKVYHQGNLKEFDNFEFMALSNWKPSYDNINRTDPQYTDPWKYYEFSRDWTKADAPNYKSRDQFSKTWLLASKEERLLLSNRQGRTCNVVYWALNGAMKVFKSP